MRPYPEYKESGVEWLGQVPIGWDVLPVKRLLILRRQINSGMACDNRLALTMNGVVPRDIDDLDGLQSSNYAGYQIFNPNDLAFKLIDLQNIKTSRVGHVFERGIMSPAYIRLEPVNIVARYAYWYFMALYWTQVFNALGGGVRQTLGSEELLSLAITSPPLAEQRAIAAFLDREVAKIDALIEESRALITALAEKRQATISHAVTRGLNPSARLKPSGVDWLGEIPEGWEVVPLKRLGWFAAGAGFPHDEQGLEGEELPFFKVNALGKAGADDVLIPDVDTVSRETADRLRATIFPKGAIVFAKIGAALLLGRIRTLPCEACIDNNMMGFFSSPDQTPDFIRFAMSLLRFDVISNPGTVPSLNESQIAEQRIPLPPRVEQLAIVDHILAETARLDALTEEAEAAIALLQERRAALISAAVTGKIDTRDTVAAA